MKSFKILNSPSTLNTQFIFVELIFTVNIGATDQFVYQYVAEQTFQIVSILDEPTTRLNIQRKPDASEAVTVV